MGGNPEIAIDAPLIARAAGLKRIFVVDILHCMKYVFI